MLQLNSNKVKIRAGTVLENGASRNDGGVPLLREPG